MSGTTPTAAIRRTGPAYRPRNPREADSTTLLVEPARRLSPRGVMARSSAPPPPSDSPPRPRRTSSYTNTTATTMNGTASMNSVVQELEGGRYPSMSDVAMPMRSATPTATGRFRSRAATTAANDAAMRIVNLLGSSPTMGAASTPAKPAKNVLTAQTPTEMEVGFVPERSVIAGESTIARTFSPTSV